MTTSASAWAGRWPDDRPLGGLRYGWLGLPLAFVALPLYVILPKHYADTFGVPLAALGAVLLAARLLDAAVDPLVGRWSDAWLARGARTAVTVAALAAIALAAGFHGLFFPAVGGSGALLAWCAALLAVTYVGYSVVAVVHQAWGARLGGDASQRARVVAWREGLALAGVLVASVLPSVAGLGVTSVVFAVLLASGIGLLALAPSPVPSSHADGAVPMTLPLRVPAFRRLLAIYLLNGIASAIPATLVLFFIDDRLQASAQQPLFLAAYFAAGALSIPLWVRLVRRFGLPRTWLAGMGLAIAVFAWASLLGPGDVGPYLAVCVLSGVALGADLTVPGAMVAGVVQRAGHGRKAEGAYFGWWNFATKLNLALAAGVALPALQFFGYEPGSRDPQALGALTLAYCALPCVLKCGAMALLVGLWIRPREAD
jgi:GPH family glycoside/pentoside/hexuronide:cation symporter